MAHRARLHDTHHFDVRRAHRSIRYDVALAVVLEGDIDDRGKCRVSRRRAAQLEAELRAKARFLERDGIRSLDLVADPEADEADRRALKRSRALLRAEAAALRRQADAIDAAARGVTVVVRDSALVTAYRDAAYGGA